MFGAVLPGSAKQRIGDLDCGFHIHRLPYLWVAKCLYGKSTAGVRWRRPERQRTTRLHKPVFNSDYTSLKVIPMNSKNSFGSASALRVNGRDFQIHRLGALEHFGFDLRRIPYSIKVLLENLLRHEDGNVVGKGDIEYVAKWDARDAREEIQFMPARVLLQDFTGVPCVVDLAAMRDALGKLGADAKKANPLIPVDLVIDHSVQVDEFGTPKAFEQNVLLEYQRNSERYALLRWAQNAFSNFRAVPPGTGIVHQVNLEYLAPVVFTKTRWRRDARPTPTPSSARTPTPR